MDSVLVTGAGGFLGRHLCSLLVKDYHVIGADLPVVDCISGIDWRTVNRDDDLGRLVRTTRPNVVVHLAFINRKPANVTERQYFDKIFAVDLPLFESLAEVKGNLLLVSSSAVYGNAEGRELIDETCPLKPISLYGLAKVFQEMSVQYYAVIGLKVCIARLFNLSGPGQKQGMLLSDWVAQSRDVAEGKTSGLKIRHRKTSRDFVDVRDASVAITLIVQNFKSGEVFNVASGKAVSLVEIIEELKKLCPVPLKITETEANPSETDVLIQRGSFDKIASVYGWRPSINWRQSLKDLWDFHGQ